jgi:tRNA threonylcarbamoyladenosine biosynthesis protein TsaE
MTVITTKNPKETQRVATLLASEVRGIETTHALVLALNGELGAGKSTFVQGFCRSLGIKDRITSPTFVLMKIYQLSGTKQKFKHLVHVDCYRIERPDELVHLGLNEILADRDAIVLIEWANRIKSILPDDAIMLELGHGEKPNERTIRSGSHACGCLKKNNRVGKTEPKTFQQPVPAPSRMCKVE